MNNPAVLGVLLAIGVCVVLPLGAILAWAVGEGRKAKMRHAERLAMIERGITPPPEGAVDVAPPTQPGASYRFRPRDDVARGMGWAVAFLCAGVLWTATDFNRFGIILVSLGVGYLTRGLVGLSRSGGADDSSGGMR